MWVMVVVLEPLAYVSYFTTFVAPLVIIPCLWYVAPEMLENCLQNVCVTSGILQYIYCRWIVHCHDLQSTHY